VEVQGVQGTGPAGRNQGDSGSRGQEEGEEVTGTKKPLLRGSVESQIGFGVVLKREQKDQSGKYTEGYKSIQHLTQSNPVSLSPPDFLGLGRVQSAAEQGSPPLQPPERESSRRDIKEIEIRLARQLLIQGETPVVKVCPYFTGGDHVHNPLKDGSYWEPALEHLLKWQQTYTNIDIFAEIGAASCWCDANPSRRKTRAVAHRFMNSWLKKANDQGGSPFPKGDRKSTRDLTTEEMFDRGWAEN